MNPPNTHTNFKKMENPKQRTSPRGYLAVIMVAAAISLILSPPSFAAQRATGSTNSDTRAGNPAELTIQIAHYLNGSSEFGLYAKDLDSGKEFKLGEDRQFDAASTMKILYAAYLYKQSDNGDLDLDAVQTLTGADIQRYGTGTIQYDPAPYNYTWRELVKRMMHESDNTAAYVIAKRMGHAELQAYAESLGMNRTNIEANTTTAGDMAIMMEKLYREQLLSHNSSQEVLLTMRNTQFEDRIPALLPGGTLVSHKTGDALNGGQHDVGIVESPDGRRYVMSVFTTGVATKDVAGISKAVYGYYHP
jgi:beta-lactamase class A